MGKPSKRNKLLKYGPLVGRKHCPFCKQDGRAAEARRRRVKHGDAAKVMHYVECSHCLARGPLCNTAKESEEGWAGEYPRSRSTRIEDMIVQSMDARRAEVDGYEFVNLNYRFCSTEEVHPLGKVLERDIPCFVLACKGKECLVTPGPGSEPVVVPIGSVYDAPENESLAELYRAKQEARDKEVMEKPDKKCLGFGEDELWTVRYDGKEIVGWTTPWRKEAKLVVSYTHLAEKEG